MPIRSGHWPATKRGRRSRRPLDAGLYKLVLGVTPVEVIPGRVEDFMLITVAICTFNRAKSLRQTLKSLIVMSIPNDISWKILIVNNNSTDHTDDVISEYVGRLPVRRELEAQAGKSNALNRVIEVAKGDSSRLDR